MLKKRLCGLRFYPEMFVGRFDLRIPFLSNNNSNKVNHFWTLFLKDSIVLQSVFTNAREKLSKEWEENDDDNEEDEGDEEEDPVATPSAR